MDTHPNHPITHMEYPSMNTTPKLLTQAQDLPRPGAESLMEAFRRAHERVDRLMELADPLHISANRGRFTEDDANRLRVVLSRLGDLERYYAEVERISAHSGECPPTFDAIRRPVEHWQTEHALWAWRLGEQELGRVATDERRTLYEAAIARRGCPRRSHDDDVTRAALFLPRLRALASRRMRPPTRRRPALAPRGPRGRLLAEGSSVARELLWRSYLMPKAKCALTPQFRERQPLFCRQEVQQAAACGRARHRFLLVRMFYGTVRLRCGSLLDFQKRANSCRLSQTPSLNREAFYRLVVPHDQY